MGTVNEELEPEEFDEEEEDGTPEHQWQVTTPPDVDFTDDDFYFDEAPR